LRSSQHIEWIAVTSSGRHGKRLKEEIEQFFVSAAFFAGKDPCIEGCPKAALKLIKGKRSRHG